MADDLRKQVIPIFRIAVLGPKGVGKTSIIKSFVDNSFDAIYEETESDLRKYRKVYDINHNLLDPQYILFQIEDL
jgi:GTPase SAR1 family protein